MRHARCKELTGDESIFCEIPELEGVWANASTEAQAVTELRDVLEEWILIRLSLRLPIPAIDGIELAVSQAAYTVSP